MDNVLKITNLSVGIEDKKILDDTNFELPEGEVHVLMGKNGSGKSSLAHVIMGNPKYEILEGDILFGEQNLLDLEPHEIAKKGIFMSFQNPLAIEGVSVMEFLKLAYNTQMKFKDSSFQPLKSNEFLKILKEKMKFLEMDREFAFRYLNQGFSGGERKKSEILQMLLLQPKLAIIDEIDSGLDIDALKIVSKGINSLIDQGTSVLLITHYKRILDHIHPDKVHIMESGKIVKSGGPDIVDQLEREGFSNVLINRNKDEISTETVSKKKNRLNMV